MKTIAVFCLSLGFCAPVLADDPTATPPLAPKATRHGGKLQGKVGSEKHPKARHDVTGHCTLLETPMNPIPGPCVSVPLELKDAKGVSLGISRTGADGSFDFAVEEEGPFRLAPTSSFYEVVSPKDEIRNGQRVDLRIRQRN